MPKTTFTATGHLVAPDLGKDGQVKHPESGLTVTAKRKINDVEFSLSVPTHTAAQKQSLNGSLLSLKSEWKNFDSKVSVDLGTKYKTGGTIYKHKFDAPGRQLDLELIWKEKGSETELAALYKLDTQKKASVKYNLQKQLALLTLGYQRNGFTVEPAIKYKVQSQEATPLLSLTQKQGKDTLKASYDAGSEKGSLEYNHKPYKLTVAAPIKYKGGLQAKAPTVLLTFSKDFEIGSNVKKHPDSLESGSGKPGSLVALEEARQGPLSDRLRAIDAVSLEKHRDLTAAAARKNREGNKGTRAGHD